jgi:hypothetical protein
MLNVLVTNGARSNNRTWPPSCPIHLPALCSPTTLKETPAAASNCHTIHRRSGPRHISVSSAPKLYRWVKFCLEGFSPVYQLIPCRGSLAKFLSFFWWRFLHFQKLFIRVSVKFARLRNDGYHPPSDTASHPEDVNLRQHMCDNVRCLVADGKFLADVNFVARLQSAAVDGKRQMFAVTIVHANCPWLAAVWRHGKSGLLFPWTTL